MNPNENQVNSIDMSPDEAKAALGHSTMLVEKHLASNAPQVAQNQPQQEQNQQAGSDIDAKLSAFGEHYIQEMDSFKKDVQSEIKTQIDSIRQDIKDALNNEVENGKD